VSCVPTFWRGILGIHNLLYCLNDSQLLLDTCAVLSLSTICCQFDRPYIILKGLAKCRFRIVPHIQNFVPKGDLYDCAAHRAPLQSPPRLQSKPDNQFGSIILSHILYRNTPLRLSSCLQRKACHAFNIARKFTLFLEPIDLLEKVLRCFLFHFIDCMDINGGSWSRSYTDELDNLMITDARGALRPAVASSRDMSR